MAGNRHRGTIQISAPPGALADNPELVYRAVAAAARVDGASADWADRLVKAAGASRQSVPVNGRPKFEVLKASVEAQVALYDQAMAAAVARIEVILNRSATPEKGVPLGE